MKGLLNYYIMPANKKELEQVFRIFVKKLKA